MWLTTYVSSKEQTTDTHLHNMHELIYFYILIKNVSHIKGGDEIMACVHLDYTVEVQFQDSFLWFLEAERGW